MKFLKRGWLLLGLMLVVLLAGCGDKTPEQMLDNAAKQMEEVKSAGYTAEMNIEYSMVGQSMKMQMQMDGVTFTDPQKAKCDMTLTMDIPGLGAQTQKLEMYVDEAYTYTGAEGTWVKTAIPDISDAAAADAEFFAELNPLLLENGEPVSEELDGVKTNKFTAVITEEMLSKVLSLVSGSMDTDSLGVVTQMFEGIGEIPFEYWLDAKTDMPVQMRIDMTKAMESMLKNTLAESGLGSIEDIDVTVSEAVMVMRYKDINNAADFEIPEAAKAAEEVPIGQ